MNLAKYLSNVKRAKGMIAPAITFGTLMFLPGCLIPKLRHAETGVALPASFNGSPNGSNGATISGETGAENSALLRVDEFYNDPVLTRLICQAVVANRELRVLNEDVQIARAEILGRRGAFLPLVGLQANAGVNRISSYTIEGAGLHTDPYFDDRLLPNPLPSFLLGLNFLVPLDIWRSLRNARDAATQRYFAAIEKRNFFMTRLVAEVAENYYGLMALDQRLEVLDQIISFQEQSLKVAQALFNAGGRGTELGVRRFQAEVRKNQSEKLIVRQEIVEVENRVNFLLGRLPQPVERNSAGFYDLTIHKLNVGVPSQLLLNRPDIRQAEREMAAAGLDVKVTRAQFFPRLDINGTVGYQAFNPAYILMPNALIVNAAGELVAPLINKAAIRADYLTASARQLESIYNYQRTIINATVEVINRLSKVQNYSKSIELKRQQLSALETAVNIATQLFQAARVEYIDVLFSQRDLLTGKTTLIDTKRQQLSAIVSVYQALGGGTTLVCPPPDAAQPDGQPLPEPPKMEEPEQPRLPGALPLPAPRKEKDKP